MTINLNLKDKKILFELDQNARAPNSYIAKKVGLSKDSVGYRIKRLEKKEFISGYRTIIDPSKLGYIQNRFALKLIDINSKTIDDIILFLKNEPGCWGVGYNEGGWDITIIYFGKLSSDFYFFYERFMNKFRKFIKEKMTGEILFYNETNRNYLIDNSSRIYKKLNFNSEKVNVDRTDIEILNLLSNNARIKLIDLADELKLSSMLVHQRIKKLEKKKIIIGYKTDINVIAIGRDYYGLKINLNDYKEKEKIMEYIYSIPEMTAMLYSIGDYDIEFDLELTGANEYHKIIDRLRGKFSTIREIESIRTIKFYHFGHKFEF